MDGYGPETYGDGFADVYDEWYADVSDAEAVADVVAELAGGGRVLELGIGSGRLALPIANRGLDVWGIDASAAMVQRLREKPGGSVLPVAIGDMVEVDVSSLPGGDGARFAVVLLAYNTLFNLTTADAQARVIARAAAVLDPRGRLVIEAAVPAREAPSNAVEARTVEIDRVVLNISRRDLDGDAIHGQLVELSERGIRLRPWYVRPVDPAAIDVMATAAGLHLVERSSDWSHTPFTAADPAHVSVYGAG